MNEDVKNRGFGSLQLFFIFLFFYFFFVGNLKGCPQIYLRDHSIKGDCIYIVGPNFWPEE